MDFQTLRDQWALKMPFPSASDIDFQRTKDRNNNPHNENYSNKPPLRSTDEIVHDLAYSSADAILMRQYGTEYTAWLSRDYLQDHHTKVWRRK